MIVGIVNAGTTSLKSKIIDINNKNEVNVLGQASLDKIKSRGHSNLVHSVGDSPLKKDVVRIAGFDNGIKYLLKWFVNNKVISSYRDIEALGFKCVLGDKNGANILTPRILEEMEKYMFVASDYNQPYLDAIATASRIVNVPMVGVFEPSFYWTIPEYRKVSGLPWEWEKKAGIKKHGYFGASHRYMAAMAYKLMGTENMNLITVNLGENSSVTAIKNGEAVDTSMDFSPASGILQGNGTGDIDGTALLFAMKKLNIGVDKALEDITGNAGLAGVAGTDTGDIKDVIKAAGKQNTRAKLAVDLYIDSIRKYIGAFSTTLGSIDCIIFSGDIGEKSPLVRERCLENMDYMGIRLDLARNKDLNGQLGIISSDYSVISKAKIYIVPNNEELVIAHFTKKVVEKGRDLTPEEMIFRL